MRGVLALVIVACPVSLVAQGTVAGIALDSATGTPLPCVEVALADSTDRAVAVAQTSWDGVFQFLPQPRGTYRLRFAIGAYQPVWSARETLTPDAEHVRSYRLSFSLRQPGPVRAPSDTAANAPAWPVLRAQAAPRYPPELRSRGITGRVVARVVVDTAGRVVPGSTFILESTDPAFTRAVQVALPHARYRPARRAHQPICALVQQPYEFDLAR